MHEQPPAYTPEKKQEQFPSREEVLSQFKKYSQGRLYNQRRFEENEKGITVYEIEFTNEDGDRVEYNFQPAKYDHTKKGLPPGARFSASIHSTIYDGERPYDDERPIGGECIANYLDGEWFPA